MELNDLLQLLNITQLAALHKMVEKNEQDFENDFGQSDVSQYCHVRNYIWQFMKSCDDVDICNQALYEAPVID